MEPCILFEKKEKKDSLISRDLARKNRGRTLLNPQLIEKAKVRGPQRVSYFRRNSQPIGKKTGAGGTLEGLVGGGKGARFEWYVLGKAQGWPGGDGELRNSPMGWSSLYLKAQQFKGKVRP